MILQALYDYYQRKCAAPNPAEHLPAYGFEEKEIPFVLEITADGKLVQLRDTRSMEGKKKVGRRYLVPQGVKRASGIAANLLWDNLEYVTGVDTRGKPERVVEQHAAFRARHAEWLTGTEDEGLLALTRFLTDWTPEAFAPPVWPEDLRDQNIVFALSDEYLDGMLHDRPAAKALWQRIGAEGAADSTATVAAVQPPTASTAAARPPAIQVFMLVRAFMSRVSVVRGVVSWRGRRGRWARSQCHGPAGRHCAPGSARPPAWCRAPGRHAAP